MDTRFYVFWIQECHSEPHRILLRKKIRTKLSTIVKEWSEIVQMRPTEMTLIHNNEVMDKLTTLEHNLVLNGHTVFTCHVKVAKKMGLL